MFEFSTYHVLLSAVGASIILAYWLPRFVSGREPAASALLIGLGLVVFGWMPGMPQMVNPLAAPGTWEVISELCVILGLFGVGLRIDRLRSWRRWMPTVRLLAIGMPLTIAGVAFAGSLAGMTMAGALLLGAILAPTDPVLAGDVQVGRPSEGGEHPVRFTLTTEAGLNDGLAFPFVYLGLAIAAAGTASISDLLVEWFWRDVLYRITVGILGGGAVGWLLGRVLFNIPRKNILADTQAGVFALAGVLVVYGVTELLEGYGFIAAFVAGLTLRRAEPQHGFHIRLHDFSETLEQALTAVLLIGLGASIPVLIGGLDLAGALIALLLILVIRPLVGWFSLARSTLQGPKRLVVAVYGVRGVGSIYYLSYVSHHVKLTNEAQLWAITVFAILLSTVLHGFTAAFAVQRATGERQVRDRSPTS